MSTFDDLVRGILEAQDEVTHLNEMGPDHLGETRKAQERRKEAIQRLRAQYHDLLTACEALLSLIDTLNMGGDLFIDNWPAVKAGRAAIDKAKREG